MRELGSLRLILWRIDHVNVVEQTLNVFIFLSAIDPIEFTQNPNKPCMAQPVKPVDVLLWQVKPLDSLQTSEGQNDIDWPTWLYLNSWRVEGSGN